VRATVDRFYAGWGVEVHSLRGTRDERLLAEELVEEAKSIEGYVLYLAGREDSKVVDYVEDSGLVNVAAVAIPKKRVRNARLEEIAWGVERARARLRLRLSFRNKSGILVHVAVKPRLESLVEDQPYADVFLATRGWREWIARLGGREVLDHDTVILERLAGGKHLVYIGPRPLYELHIPDVGMPKLNKISGRTSLVPQEPLQIDEYWARRVIDFYEKVSKRLLRDALARAEEELGSLDAIVVPWSGGKDSTIALILARNVYKDIVAIYVDTGVDFPQTREYVMDYADKLNIELIYTRAPVRENIRMLGMPTHNNRWCTGLKLEALREVLRRLGERIIVVTGDRDAESEARSRRPPIRLERLDTAGRLTVVTVTPLKQWSTLLLQLYARHKGVKLNPLYEYGFYRLGCYICPALRSWEKMLILRDPRIASRLIGLPYYRRVSSGKAEYFISGIRDAWVHHSRGE